MTRYEDNDGTKGKIGVREGVRRTSGVTPISGHLQAPDPEVVEKQARRRFTAQYKLRILEEADACTEPGQIGVLLRREGLYSSNLTTWRKQRDEGQLQALAPKKRGRKRKPKNPLADRVAQLERKNRRLEHELKQARTIIDVQKKISDILGIPQPDTDLDEDGSGS
jgi:transposase